VTPHRGGSIRNVGLESADIKTAPLVCRKVVPIIAASGEQWKPIREIAAPIRSFYRTF
jgi:hypothetical protein